MPPLEAVPNVSEGRDARVVARLGQAFASGGARLLDTHVDADHHRSVLTLLGDETALADGLVAGVAEASRTIDLRRHTGAHPRVGAADVVPIVPLAPGDLVRAMGVARAVARRIGDELRLPVFLYGALAGGFLLGIVTELSTWEGFGGGVDPVYKPVVAFAVLILVLLARPQGLLGRARLV